MNKTAMDILAQARAFLGCKEADGSHKKIIDIYNAHKPLARGYKVKYTDPWCATFVSAVAIAAGADFMPTECSCNKMIELYKKLGAWVENEERTPNPGDILFYDWDDSGKGDNQGRADHVGIVESINGGRITVIEGNYKNGVNRRKLQVGGRYIRGYGVPAYGKDQEVCTLEVTVLKKGAKGACVKAMQTLLIGYGFSCGKKGADGSFGGATDSALRTYQKAKGLSVDGACGPKTWASLLGV